MNQDERAVTVEAPEPVPAPRSRARRLLETLGTVAAVAAVIAVVNVGAIPGGLTVGQLVVAFVALSTAVEGVRWIRRGPRQEARRRLTKGIADYGGGVYGTAALATFVWLNVMDVLDDIAAAGSVAGWIGQMSLGWLIGEMVEAVRFAVQAMIWPWYWFSTYGFRVAAVVAVVVLAADALRKPVARWLAARRAP